MPIHICMYVYQVKLQYIYFHFKDLNENGSPTNVKQEINNCIIIMKDVHLKVQKSPNLPLKNFSEFTWAILFQSLMVLSPS